MRPDRTQAEEKLKEVLAKIEQEYEKIDTLKVANAVITGLDVLLVASRNKDKCPLPGEAEWLEKYSFPLDGARATVLQISRELAKGPWFVFGEDPAAGLIGPFSTPTEAAEHVRFCKQRGDSAENRVVNGEEAAKLRKDYGSVMIELTPEEDKEDN